MTDRIRSWLPQSIAARLTTWFLVLALLPCLFLTFEVYRISSGSLAETARGALRAVAESRAERLERYVRDRMHLAAALAQIPGVVQVATGAGGTAAERDARRELVGRIAGVLGVPNVLVFSREGDLLLQLRRDIGLGDNIRTGPLRDSPLARSVENSRTLLMAEMSAFASYPEASDPIAFLTAPILGPAGAVAGVLALQLDSRPIWDVFRDTTGLGRTGELVAGVLEPDGRQIRLFGPLRHRPDTAARPRLRLGDPQAGALQRAVRAERGFGEDVDYRGERVIAAWGYLPTFQWGLVVKQDAREAYALINRLRIVTASLLAASLALVVVAAPRVARSIARPIQRAAMFAERIAHGDLTGRIDDADRVSGEPGQMLRALRVMNDDLRGLIAQVQRSSVSLMATANQIAATARQQERSVHDFSVSTTQTAAAVHEISATSAELLGTMNQVNALAESTATLAEQGRDGLAVLDRTMSELAGSTGAIEDCLAEIVERAQSVNLVVTTVTKVADQTNLLSINAAIEAEKAGAVGRGFRVVAREIRHLADQTAAATLEIEEIVTRMQQSARAGVEQMTRYDQRVRAGAAEVARIADRLARIIDAIADLTPRFEQVTEGMRAQSEGADQIREAMAQLSDSAGTSAESLREFHAATESLRAAVAELRDDIARFQVEPEAAN